MIKKTTNILVIGNGFDLAHGLPTKYIDFLKFIDFTNKYGKCKDEMSKNTYLQGTDFKNDSEKLYFLTSENAGSVFENAIASGWNLKSVKNNLWIRHFCKETFGTKNWVDFEAEISKIIQNLEIWLEHRKTYGKLSPNNRNIPAADRMKTIEAVENIDKFFFPNKIERNYGKEKANTIVKIGNFEVLLKLMEEDLDVLIQHLEIYLLIMVQYIDKTKKLSFVEKMDIDCLLSFNYTNTYEEIYKEMKGSHYIHGFIDGKRDKTNNNMVLGIEEYLQGDDRNTNRTFVWFKKYYQRIYKKTGSNYKRWFEIAKEMRRQVEVYIIGHSLAITDKDIFKELILSSSKTVVYYFDKVALKDLVANMVEIVGQDVLIEKTSDGSLIFEEQPDKFAV